MFERLIYIREEYELTQQQIANIIGVSRSVISKWENNVTFIPLKHLNTYSNHFKVSLDYLVGFSNKKNYEKSKSELNNKIIAERIREFRKSNNLTLRELAKELNTSSSTISAYETGKVTSLTSFAYQICLNHKISLDWLCGKI